jgi:hypothetical protein
MKKLLILSLFALGSMFARDCGCNRHEERVEVVERSPAAACPTVFVGEIPKCQELRLVTVPAQKEILYSCPNPSPEHIAALKAHAINN